jgi:hypothetical protein
MLYWRASEMPDYLENNELLPNRKPRPGLSGFQEKATRFTPTPELKATINDGIDRSVPILLRTVRLLNVAMKLSEPLIVAYGDVYSGINATAIYRAALSGKEAVQAAYYAAYKLNTQLFHFRVSRDTTVRDLLYAYDVDRLQFDYQTAAAMRDVSSPDKSHYVEPRVLW